MGITAGYKLKINGGAYVEHIIDVGNVLNYEFTGFTPGVPYSVDGAPYDQYGNLAAWCPVVTQTIARPPVDLDDLPNIFFWFEADGQSFANNDPVGTLVDQSGNSHSPTSSGSNRPTYKTNILNGLPVIRFDGTDDYLDFYDGGISIGAYTIGIVYKDFTISNGQTRLLMAGNTNLDEIIQSAPSAWNYGLNGVGTSPTSFTFPSTGMLIAKVDNTTDNVEVWINGAKVFDGSLGTIASLARQIRFGLSLGSAYTSYDVAMAFMTTGFLDDATIGYLFEDNQAKYNLY